MLTDQTPRSIVPRSECARQLEALLEESAQDALVALLDGFTTTELQRLASFANYALDERSIERDRGLHADGLCDTALCFFCEEARRLPDPRIVPLPLEDVAA